MKKILFIVALVAFASCKSEKEVEDSKNIVFKASVENATANTIEFRNQDKELIYTGALNEDGVLTDTLQLETGLYSLQNGKNYFPVYINEGDNIVIRYDNRKFYETYSIEGSEISDYLLKRNRNYEQFFGKGPKVYKLSEEDFRKKLDSFKTATHSLLNEYNDISDEEKARELRNLNYTYVKQLKMYPVYHSIYNKEAGDGKPLIIENKGLDSVAFNNVEDFKYSQDYRDLVKTYYKAEALKKARLDTTSKDIAYLNVLNTIENEYIKNSLAYEEVLISLKKASNKEGYYNAYMKLSTNPKHKETVTKIYNEKPSE